MEKKAQFFFLIFWFLSLDVFGLCSLMESAADVAEIGENSLKIGSSPPSMPERKSFQKTRGKVLDDGELKPFEFPILNPSPLYLHFSPEKRFWDYTPGHKQEMLKNEIPSDNAAYFSKNLKEYSNSMSPISILEKTISLEGHETIGMHDYPKYRGSTLSKSKSLKEVEMEKESKGKEKLKPFEFSTSTQSYYTHKPIFSSKESNRDRQTERKKVKRKKDDFHIIKNAISTNPTEGSTSTFKDLPTSIEIEVEQGIERSPKRKTSRNSQ